MLQRLLAIGVLVMACRAELPRDLPDLRASDLLAPVDLSQAPPDLALLPPDFNDGCEFVRDGLACAVSPQLCCTQGEGWIYRCVEGTWRQVCFTDQQAPYCRFCEPGEMVCVRPCP